VEKYRAVTVTRTRTDVTTVYVKLTDKAEEPVTDIAKQFLEELAAKRPVDFENRFRDIQTELDAYDYSVRSIDAMAVDVIV
jgi:hypothetical protein